MVRFSGLRDRSPALDASSDLTPDVIFVFSGETQLSVPQREQNPPPVCLLTSGL